jgi:hypothetical protein
MGRSRSAAHPGNPGGQPRLPGRSRLAGPVRGERGERQPSVAVRCLTGRSTAGDTSVQCKPSSNWPRPGKFALPAVNVINTSTVNAVMETAAELKSPAIIQFSNGGAHSSTPARAEQRRPACLHRRRRLRRPAHPRRWPNCTARPSSCTPTTPPRSCCPGSTACSTPANSTSRKHGKPLFSSHMLDLSEESIWKRTSTSAHAYLERMSKIGMTLEIELGVTGGEEDGVDNSGVDSSKLYTQPEDVAYAYENCRRSATASRSPPRSATCTASTSRVTSSCSRSS